MYYGPIQDVMVLQDGRRTQSLRGNPFVKYEVHVSYNIEVYATSSTTAVHFQVYDRSRDRLVADTWQRRPILSGSMNRFFMFGPTQQRQGRISGGALSWKAVPVGRLLTVRIVAVEIKRNDVNFNDSEKKDMPKKKKTRVLERDQVYVQFIA